MTHFFRQSILPTWFLIATIIGAGMFALPFVFSQSGLLLGVVYLLFFSGIAALVHLLYADIIVRTKETHRQFPGYIRTYLGAHAGRFADITTFAALVLTLTAYIVLAASFVRILVPALAPLPASILFWTLASITIFISVRRTAFFNATTGGITLLAIGALFIYWNATLPLYPIHLPIFLGDQPLVPFGPVLFSFIGFSAIPALVAYSRTERVPLSRLRHAIIAGSTVPAFFYFLFAITVLALSPTVSPDAVSGLIATLPRAILLILGMLGFVSLWDSYSAIGRDLNKLLEYEWHISPALADIITISIPFLLYMFGLRDFIALIGAIGGILFGAWGILIVLAWRKAIRVHMPSVKFTRIPLPRHASSLIYHLPFPITVLLILLFAGGILYETRNVFLFF